MLGKNKNVIISDEERGEILYHLQIRFVYYTRFLFRPHAHATPYSIYDKLFIEIISSQHLWAGAERLLYKINKTGLLFMGDLLM
jgi:hypothetical protein